MVQGNSRLHGLSTYAQIACHVTGSRHFFVFSSRGTIELLCSLILNGNTEHKVKSKKLVESALATSTMDLTFLKFTC